MKEYPTKISAYQNIGDIKYKNCASCLHRKMFADYAYEYMYDHDSRPQGYLGNIIKSGFTCKLGHNPRYGCHYQVKGYNDDKKDLCNSGWTKTTVLFIVENNKCNQIW